MTQFVTLQLKNHAGTEVDYTVQGINYATGVAAWNAAGASYDASRFATFSIQQPTLRSTRARVKLKLTLPIMDPVNPLRKIDELIGSVEFVLPKQSELADRRDLRAALADFLTDAVVVNAIEKFEAVY